MQQALCMKNPEAPSNIAPHSTDESSHLSEWNKRWCNKRWCKSKKCGNMQIWPNLREFGRICAKFARKLRKFAQICASLRNCFCKKCANLREIYGPVCYGTVCSCLTGARAIVETCSSCSALRVSMAWRTLWSGSRVFS